ncbi:ionotropic receptor 25a-like [Mizuhopecten yessoensis]|uniref:Glutamate receptor ionotropic, kainate 3 n=1 Tax=Mizuhopecten yessoensis TaxID=6573 RepID=A0A210R2D8_MIZYE|nr:ionotropic receptor 25a-like [Mizuhopecten yessoensis]OWF55104.1 Glutamate receptor ionotropic, kainate 3 [Mizuhopecten yessoensis]
MKMFTAPGSASLPGMVFLLLEIAGTIFPTSAQIVAVIDKDKNSSVYRTLHTRIPVASPKYNITMIQADDSNSINTLDQVCTSMNKGGFALLDATAPAVGPLIRSFARTLGMAYFTLVDQSTLLPVDFHPQLHLAVEPPGSAMFHIIPDIVKHENLTKVAILYDESFDLHVIPKRILTGVPTQHLYQEISKDETALSSQLKRLKDLEIKVFFVLSNSTTITALLGMVHSLNMFEEKYNWFVLSKGSNLNCHKCKTGSVIRINGKHNFEMLDNYIRAIRNLLPNNHAYNALAIQLDEIFIYDFQMMLDEVLKDTHPTEAFSVPKDDCYGVKNSTDILYQQSKRIIAAFKEMTREGLYGEIRFINGSLRQKLVLNLQRQTFSEGLSSGNTPLGNWTESNGLVLKVKSLIESQTKRTLRVVIAGKYPPFVYENKNNSNTKYTGYCIDLLNKIATIVGFDYTIYEVPDGLVGAMADDGTWNGVINELIQKKADIAVGPISVMAERENVVDFTVPYYDLVGLTILMKKPKFEYFLFKFLIVLHHQVWLCIIAAYFLFSVLLCAFDKLSPFSYQNNLKLWKGHGPEPRIFTLKEGVWFCMMSLTPQGGGEAPRALSGRLIAATWWLFGFIIIATYTANLAAHLTVSRMETLIKSLDDLSAQYKVKYGPRNGSAAMVYFKRMAEIEERFYSIWKQMSLNDSLDAVERAKLAVWDYPVSNKYTKLWETMKGHGFSNTLEESIEQVMSGEYAYIGDAAENKYQTLTNCEVEAVGEEFSRKPFAFAVQDGSPLRSEISNAILQLLNERFLEKLKARWWTENPEKIECPNIEDESEGISIKNIGGVFLVIAVGTGLALICLAFEFYLYRYKPKLEAKRYGVAKKQSRAELVTNGVNGSSSVNTSRTSNGSLTTISNGESSIWPDITLDYMKTETNGNSTYFAERM